MSADFTFETYDETKKSQFPKTQFLDMDFGTHVVRILSQPHKVFVHYFKGRGSVACLGSDCPVCKVNKSLKEQYPDSYRNQTSYNGSSPRHYVNVLDRTVVKVCPACQAENKRDVTNHFANVCKGCSEVITDVPETISDKVKVANFSETIASELMMMRATELDADGEPLGLGGFDIAIRVTKSGGKKNISVIPTNTRDDVEVPEDSLYDLSTIVIKLNQEEMVNFMKGISLKDLFAARKATAKVESVGIENATLDEINDTLKELGIPF